MDSEGRLAAVHDRELVDGGDIPERKVVQFLEHERGACEHG